MVRRRFHRGIQNFFKLYSPLLDFWVIFDNSTETPFTIAYEEFGKEWLGKMVFLCHDPESNHFRYIMEKWLSYANIIGKKVQISDEKFVFEGLVINVDDSGCLIVKTSKETVRVVSGDLTIL